MQQLEHIARVEIARTRGLSLYTPVGQCDVDSCDDAWLGYICEMLKLEAPLTEDAATIRRRIYKWNRDLWIEKLASSREARLSFADPTAYRMELS